MLVLFRDRAAVLVALLIVLFALPALAQHGQDGEEEGPAAPDSTAAPPDSIAPGAGQVGGGSFRQGFGAGRAFRPTYKLDYTRDQDVSSWGHDFTTAKLALTDRVSFLATANISVRNTDALNRENRQEHWTAGLDVDVTRAIVMGVKLDRNTQSDVRNEGSSTEVRSFREKETADFSTSYSDSMFSCLKTTASARAGLEKNRYSNVSSRGSAQGVSASVSYHPVAGLSSSVNYSGSHSLLDSEQGALRSTDESVSHTIGAGVDYTWGANTLKVTLNRMSSMAEYPKDEQKERRGLEDRSTAVSGTFEPVPDMKLSLGYDHSRTESSYSIDPTRDSDTRSRAVTASVTYTIAGTNLTSQFSSDVKRSEYTGDQTGDSYGKSLLATASRSFGNRVSAKFSGRMTLYSHHFDDTEANDQDRDLYDRDGTISLDYTPRSDLSASLSLRAREDQLIYIRRTRTGDNKSTQTFSVQPAITKKFSRGLSVTQRYDLSADYTIYTYDEDRNFLVRNLGVTTELRWSGLTSLDATLSHKYTAQDEGAYVRGEDGFRRYGKNSERDTHTMRIAVKYELFGVVDIEASQDFTVQQKWNLLDGVRSLAWERHDTSLTGKASADFKLAQETTLKFSVARTERDATSIAESQRRVWNIAVSINKNF